MISRPDPEKYPVKRSVSNSDIFKSGYELPQHVCILAPGLNGAGNYDKIGPVYTIAVNYGITIPVHIDAWLVADWWGIQKGWFPKADAGWTGQRLFSVGLAEHCNFWKDTDITFELVKRRAVKRGYAEERATLTNRFRPDETSVGIAIDLSYRFGARHIDLIGVDMQGYDYYDGTKSTCESCDRTGTWLFCEMLNDVIKWHQERGVVFRSHSPTALKI